MENRDLRDKMGAMADERARYLRRNQTDAERRLWSALRRKGLGGWRFRRQHPLGGYVVDFICLERKLVIELDGERHSFNRAFDERRDAWIKSRGYGVLRFWNHDVYNNLDGVVETILENLQAPHR
ncbi:endonuclease domain-containing protein [Hyphococcus sp.]|uniref:endonuclease domain-containing protein n=1 Tax=Hyphococcus sp. TaxID=2038636 RepID=UPI0035C67241